MSEFERSNWAQPEHSREYRDNSDNYIQERTTLLRMLASFYRHFVKGKGLKRVLDLGCGDGVLAKTLYEQDRGIEITVTDGSGDMIKAARLNLSGLPVSEFCQITFDAIINGQFARPPFDLAVSAFAIHHLDLARKALLFQRIIELLKPGGYFVNIDVAETDHPPYTDWYYVLWKEWIIDRQQCLKSTESFADIPEKARAMPENHYDSLQSQLTALGSVGFSEVECHYRYGLFSLYEGRKPLAER
jgi:tRNA (cmo5U34)-methyltransferase